MPTAEERLDRIRNEYPPIVTTAQVAELLGLNPRTVLLMVADGRLPASRLPGSRKFHFFLDDVIDTLKQHMITPPAPPPVPRSPAKRGTAKAAKAAKASKAAKKRSR
ncbi:MAG: helix-turn-helix domain-containing protein [Actinomycetota bacterium]|nr:helix-turn-helix domain-containing protein [Actinomycetota bacterium]